MRIKNFAFKIMFSLLICEYCFGAFENNNIGVRNSALGNTFLAIADDVNAVFSNPAGLVQLKTSEVSMAYSSLYGGLDGLNNMSIGFGIPIDEKNTLGTAGFYYLSTGNGIYNETTIGLAYSYVFVLNKSGMFDSKKKEFDKSVLFESKTTEWISVGIVIKDLIRSYTANEYTIANTEVFGSGLLASAVSFDVALLYYMPQYSLKVGAVAENISGPSIELKTANKMPMNFKAGVSYYISDSINLAGVINLFGFDTEAGVGAEFKLIEDVFVLRSGAELGNGNKLNICAGFGYSFTIFQGSKSSFDYSFVYPLNMLDGFNPSHQFSLIIKLGKVEDIDKKRKDRNY